MDHASNEAAVLPHGTIHRQAKPVHPKRRLFSRSALGMTGMHESTTIYASVLSNK